MEDKTIKTVDYSELDNMLRVGVITQTHGIRGEVKIYPTTDDPKRFDSLKKVYMDYTKKGVRGVMEQNLYELEIEDVKYFKQFVILKFKGIDNINDIEMYKHMDLYVTREDAVPLEEGEFYIADLIGLDVIDDTGKKIGVLKDVLQTGANDVYIVTGNENVGNKELMLPKIDECVRDINLEEKTITVHIMKGLLDL